ncbi:hypothetical protein D9613_007374 [Agrocybe pediades]|uniref:Zn(2)-C6 fungal-type domain-containing protein n=1 Tax=Agrocybe pediades TaxID=84607 RepID=A0A8H4QMR2_9AGAR|nr:hypothetical protein D9613_007374 [Agrocybe pediades]
MSSNEDEYNDGEGSSELLQSLKKRRIQRACDICRRKKVRCDGVQMPGNRCSNCITFNNECTYIEAAKKRGPPKGYVESLENRVERLDKLLRRLLPDESVYKKLSESVDGWSFDQPVNPSSIVGNDTVSYKRPPGAVTPLESVTSAIRGVNSESIACPEDEDEDDATLRVADKFKKMEMDPKMEYRFFGKSSGAMLVHTALELKQEYVGGEPVPKDVPMKPLQNPRKQFWTTKPWEKRMTAETNVTYRFPEDDLAKALVNLYFARVNLYLPLLHRPTFEKFIKEGLHLSDNGFACVYLLVCAVGARFSEDPRVLLDGVESLQSAGWKWFEQVQIAKKSLLSPPTLYDIQLYGLAVQFLQGSSAPQACWTMVGIGIRLAQDVGAHRRKLNNHTLTPEDEQWKRAFWVLVVLDRMVSSSLGRPCAIQDEDFDLDLPVECDDEYWENEDPDKRFKQPPNKPCLVTSFNLSLKLHQILAFSLRTIYSINKSKILLGFVGQQWEQHIVAELDSALNKWVDSVPDHLRWDPNREDENFFNQSVLLYAAYYHVQILIHRPFIPSPSKPSPLSFPSLAICTNAARSCSHIIDVQRKRNDVTTPQSHMYVFTSGVVLLLSIWGGKRSGLSTDPNKEMVDVHKCMQALRSSEERWHSAGRLWDILYELASVGDLPLPQSSPPTNNKRTRDSETPITSSPPSSNPTPSDGPRNIAGSKRVHKELYFSSSNLSSRPSYGSISSTNFGQQQPSSAHQNTMSALPRKTSDAQSHHHQQIFGDFSPSSSTPSPMSSIPQTPQSASHCQPTPVECFSLPVYSNELGRIPLHSHVTFSAQAQLPPQNLTVQPPQTPQSLWFSGNNTIGGGIPSSSQIPLTGPVSNNTSIFINNANPAANGYPSIGEMSSMTDNYPMDATALAAGMMFDTMAGTLGYQQSPTMYTSGVGSGMNTLDQNTSSSSSSSLPSGMNVDQVYGRAMAQQMGMGGDVRLQADPSSMAQQQQHQHQQHQQQQNMAGQVQPGMMYGFDSDTLAMWSSAPTGLELDEWGTYLTNVSEMTHGHQASGPGGTDYQ